MTAKRITSREFNQDSARAKRAAASGPVFITDRGRLSYVLVSIEEYQRLAGTSATIVELLADPAGVEDLDLETPAAEEIAEPASID